MSTSTVVIAAKINGPFRGLPFVLDNTAFTWALGMEVFLSKPFIPESKVIGGKLNAGAAAAFPILPYPHQHGSFSFPSLCISTEFLSSSNPSPCSPPSPTWTWFFLILRWQIHIQVHFVITGVCYQSISRPKSNKSM